MALGFGYLQGLPGVPKLKEGLNPATWMLQISTPGMEKSVGLDFAEAYKQSHTFRSPHSLFGEFPVTGSITSNETTSYNGGIQ